jgi:RNA polymerase-binding protein DksA
MARKSASPKASTRETRARIERERDDAVQRLRDLGITPDAGSGARLAGGDHPLDEGDHAQESERRDLSFITRERLAERINRLTAALERINEGSYGKCEECGGPIEASRLTALPEVTTCLECQRRRERVA